MQDLAFQIHPFWGRVGPLQLKKWPYICVTGVKKTTYRSYFTPFITGSRAHLVVWTFDFSMSTNVGLSKGYQQAKLYIG